MNNADQQFSIITAVQSPARGATVSGAVRTRRRGASLRLRHFSMPMTTAFLDILAEVHLGIEVFAWLIAAG
jgi:hypothetical protein